MVENYNTNLNVDGQATSVLCWVGRRAIPRPVGDGNRFFCIAVDPWIHKKSWKKENGARDFFIHYPSCYVTKRWSLVYAGARARRTSNPNELAADDGRTYYFQTWPLLRLETLPVPSCPFATKPVSLRVSRKTDRTKPPLPVIRHSRWVIFGRRRFVSNKSDKQRVVFEASIFPYYNSNNTHPRPVLCLLFVVQLETASKICTTTRVIQCEYNSWFKILLIFLFWYYAVVTAAKLSCM